MEPLRLVLLPLLILWWLLLFLAFPNDLLPLKELVPSQEISAR